MTNDQSQMTNLKWKIFFLAAALNLCVQAQTIPHPVQIIEPLELPAPRVLRPQWPEFTITLERAVVLFLQNNQANAAPETTAAMFELKRNFYESVLAHHLVLVAEENLNYLDTYANRMQARLEENMSPASDVMKWRVERARVADALAEAKLTERLARIKVIQMLGGVNSTHYPELFFYLAEAPAQPLKFTLEQLLETGLRARQAQADTATLRLRRAAEIEAAFVALETHRQRAMTSKEQFAPTELLRSVSATFYYEGEAALVVLLDAQRTRWEARQQYWRALGAYYLSRAELEAALGASLNEVEP